MKLKSLLFGSAAVLAAGTGAQAADLPTVEPVEYVRICDAFGTGFYYIPGTDTCLRVSGRVRVESHYVNVDDDIPQFANGVVAATIPQSELNNWTSRARGNIRLDARTQADIGLIRAFIDFELTIGHDDFSQAGGSPNYDDNANEINLAAAFVQISNDWGTYTAGHTGSFFDFFGSHGYGTRLSIDDPTTEQTLFAWTFAGGNGFSFTIAAEDPASSGRRLNGDDDYEGQEFPDGVANIRVDQGWGSAQIMGAVRHINDVNGDGLGFAVGAGLSIGVPGGWTLDAQGGYSEGAIAYITTDPGAIGDFNGPDGDDTNEAWSVRGGITGPLFSPNLTVWLDGSYTEAEEDDGGDDYEFWAVMAGAAYELAPGLAVGPEFVYNEIDGDDAGEDFEAWGVMWRLQRDF